MLEMRFCSPCGDDRPFEVPPCQDGHGPDCLDLACVDCGHAIVVGHQAGHQAGDPVGDGAAGAGLPALVAA